MKKLVAEWVKKAEEDLAAVEVLGRRKPGLHDIVCFHCQQTAEKYLKALLQHLGEPIPKTHDLEHLLDLLVPRDAALRSLRRGLNRLTEYAVEYRYPGARTTARRAQSALRLARRVRDAVRSRLGLDKRRKPAP
jgi:HEPN domain-containing protein